MGIYALQRHAQAMRSFDLVGTFVKKSRAVHGSKVFQLIQSLLLLYFNISSDYNLDGSPMRAFVTCDGEAKQIEVFQQDDMIDLFTAQLIDSCKTPASCSAICQSSDASLFLRATKKAALSIHTTVTAIH
jgi:hypothetical protein